MTGIPLLLGHRGSRVLRSAPENTFASFDVALTQGCDGFEFDVRRTADGRAVVVHDPNHGGISVARAKSGQLTALPELEQVLEKYGSKGFLDIELKVKGLEPALLAVLRRHPPIRDYVVSSFHPEILIELRTRRSGIPLGIICDKASQLSRAATLPVEYLIVQEKLVSEDLIRDMHTAGRKLLAWTVNKPETMLRFTGWGIDGLVSDDPALLAGTLRGNAGMALLPAVKPAKVKAAKRRGKPAS
jgi:glycerophosphoryl diester phosphodiesterase